MTKPFLDQIEEYLIAAGVAPSTLGRKTVGDPNFVTRLRSGGRCWPETMERVYAYMRANPAPSSEKPSDGEAA